MTHRTDRRSFLLAYLLWFFGGVLGIHRFYLDRPWTGLLYFATGGLFGVGWLFDAFWTAVMVNEQNELRAEPIFVRRYRAPSYAIC